MASTARVAVTGGGISGLTTAYALRRGADPPDVVLVEADRRLGGKVYTRQSGGLPVDVGPDGFLTRSPAMMALIEDLGLTSTLAAPAQRGAYVWSRGRLRPLPSGSQFGIPDRLWPVLRSGLLSPPGTLRAGLDLVLPRRRLPADPSIAELLGPRFGREVVERLVDPLLGGVHAGRADSLSARSTVPDIEALSRRERSIHTALRRRARQAGPAAGQPPAGPVFQTIDGGLSRLIDALAARIDGCEIRLGTEVTTLRHAEDGYTLSLADGSTLDADAVVLATPAFATADLVEPLSPAAAAALREIPYTDVASVTLAYAPDAVTRPLDATGFLVPSVEGRFLVGCTWLSAKWPHLADREVVLIRCLVGRHGDRRWTTLSDADLVHRVHEELAEAMGLAAPPSRSLVQRWPRALAQYTVGHGDRVERIEAAVRTSPGLWVTGAGYRGVGLAGCVTQALNTAEAVLDELPRLRTRQGLPR